MESAELFAEAEVGHREASETVSVPRPKAAPVRSKAKKSADVESDQPDAADKFPKAFVPGSDTVYDPKCTLCQKHGRDCYGEITEGVIGTCKWCMFKKVRCSLYNGPRVSSFPFSVGCRHADPRFFRGAGRRTLPVRGQREKVEPCRRKCRKARRPSSYCGRRGRAEPRRRRFRTIRRRPPCR
jgi:hypothetical protein